MLIENKPDAGSNSEALGLVTQSRVGCSEVVASFPPAKERADKIKDLAQ